MARFLHGMVLATVVGTGVSFGAGDGPPSTLKKAELIARFRDGTIIRRITLQEDLEIQTKYGKLTIPVSDLRRIEFGLHIPEKTAQRIAGAMHQLGAKDFQNREAASKELRALGAPAYPALLEAAKGSDPEVARRAQEVLLYLRERVAQEDLQIPTEDVIHTSNCVLSGRILSQVLKGKTMYFGELPMKLGDLRSIHTAFEAQLAINGTTQAVDFDQWVDSGFRLDADTGLVIDGCGKVVLTHHEQGPIVSEPDGIGIQLFPGLGFQQPGTLIGRVGEKGEPFYIGKRYEGKPGRAGRLYLRVVPMPKSPAAFTGSYKVTIVSVRR